MAPEASGRCGLLRRSISRSWYWLMTLLAAFNRAAVSEPSPIIRSTDGVMRRAGSGLCADPNAVSAPEITPNVGGRSVNGRVNVKYSRALEAKPLSGVSAIPSMAAWYDTRAVSGCGNHSPSASGRPWISGNEPPAEPFHSGFPLRGKIRPRVPARRGAAEGDAGRGAYRAASQTRRQGDPGEGSNQGVGEVDRLVVEEPARLKGRSQHRVGRGSDKRRGQDDPGPVASDKTGENRHPADQPGRHQPGQRTDPGDRPVGPRRDRPECGDQDGASPVRPAD